MPQFSLADLLAQYKKIKGGDDAEAAMISPSELGAVDPDPLTSGMAESLRSRAELPRSVDYGEQFGPPVPEISKIGSPTKNIAQPKSSLKDFSGGGVTDDTVAGLANAQKSQNDIVLLNQLAKAAETFGGGLSGAISGGHPQKPVGAEAYDKNIEQAPNVVKQYLARAKQEDSDPASKKSNFARESMKRLGINVPADTSYETIQAMYPQFVKMRDMDEQIAARKEMAKYRADDLKLRQKELDKGKVEKKAEKDEKFAQSLRKELTSGELGKARSNYVSAKKAEIAVGEFAKDPSGYKDYGALMLGLKALQGDQSVVREAEIRLGTNAASLFQKAENAISSAMTGRSLGDKQKKAILDSVKTLSEIAKTQYKELANPIISQARGLGYDINKLVDKKNFPEFFEDEQREPSSGSVEEVINSRSADENKARLEQLRNKFGKR